MTADTRRIRVSAANLKHSHLYVTRQLLDFFPKDAVGGPRRKGANGHGFDLILDGLGKTVHTDIASDGKNCRVRGFLIDVVLPEAGVVLLEYSRLGG